MESKLRIKPEERILLRDLFKQLMDLKDELAPVLEERRLRWIRMNRREPGRPPVIHGHDKTCFETEVLPLSCLQTTDSVLRDIEYEIRAQLYLLRNSVGDSYWFPHTTPYRNGVYEVPKVISDTGWGLQYHEVRTGDKGGAYALEGVMTSRDDLKKIHPPEVIYDEPATQRNLAVVEESFGDLCPVRLEKGGVRMVAFHLMLQYFRWRGIERAILDLYDEPQLVHDTMAVMEDGYRQLLRQYVDLNLLSLNNHSYIFETDLLPAPGFNPDRVRPCDCWTWAEAQELTGVSPEMHWEFCMQYEARLVEPFGLSSYACCEDMTHKIEYVARLPKMHQIGVTPWADVKKCVEQIGTRFVISWRPNPSYCAGDFHEEKVREYLRTNLELLNGTAFHVFLKDTQTCSNEPWRFLRWQQICEEEIARIWGPSSENARVICP